MRIVIPEDGVHRTTFPDGGPKEEFTIKNGEEHGGWRRWHPNGVLAEERHYRDGLLQGVARQWNRRGELLGTSRFKDGTGILREWHENGQVSEECSYVRGEITGRMRIWGEDGMLYVQRYYLDGRPVSKKGYEAKRRTVPGLPCFQDEKTTNTLGNYVRRLRRTAREQAQLGPTPEQIEAQRCFDERCKREVRAKDSQELVSWLTKGARHERELGELSKSEALKLARKLYALGAARVWATEIERDEDGAQYSRRLIVALPTDSPKRDRIYTLCAGPARPLIGCSASAILVGRNFMSVSLM